MQPHHTFPQRFQWVVPVTVLFLALSLVAPTATAVEPGGLSVTAEGTTATRAIFNMHPDEKIRNEDHMAMALVHPEYWHYSVMSDDGLLLVVYSEDAIEADLKVFAISGRKLQASTITVNAGITSLKIDTSTLPGGVYFWSLTSDSWQIEGKTVLVR